MKLIATGILSAALLMTAGAPYADGSAHKRGETIKHGANSVGHGLSKIYHDAAHDTHKIIARNSKNPHVKASHLKRAARQYKKANRQEHRAKRDMKSAKKASR
jgi:hypothetical protein